MYIDFHSHIHMYTSEEVEEIMKVYENLGVFTLSNSLDIASYNYSSEKFSGCRCIYPSFGIHPWRSDSIMDLNNIDSYLDGSHIIGEVGLDYLWTEIDRDVQMKVFRYILEYCKKNNVIMTIHTKNAESDVVRLLKEYDYSNCVIHWYSGDIENFQILKDMGCYFTVSGQIINDDYYLENYKIPMDKILLETDNPGSYGWITGEESGYDDIIKIYKKLALRLNMTSQELVKKVEENFTNLMKSSERSNRLLIEIWKKYKGEFYG